VNCWVYKMKHGVLIIECLDENDPGSEGRVLEEVLKLMQVESKLVRVTSIKQLLAAIAKTGFKHVHISTHGAITDAKKFRGLWTPNGEGTKRTVEKCGIKVGCTSIVSTACRSGSKGLAKYVTEKWGVDFYIAPTGSLHFHNATLFSHIYYHKLFRIKGTVFKAFASYAENYKNPHGFVLYRRKDI
jgi:hypothetical protein